MATRKAGPVGRADVLEAELAERAADDEILLEARLLAATDRLELADPAFRAELDEFLRLAATSRQPRFRYAALVRRAALALLAGRLEEAGQLIGQAKMLGEECGEPGVRDVRYDQGWDLLTAQGRLGELAGTLPEMFPDPESAQARGTRAEVLIAAGALSGAERDALLSELAAAAGPAGQSRLLGDQSERARKAVTARIRDIIGRIEQMHPALAGHLRESITTGTRCSYSPPTPVTWRL